MIVPQFWAEASRAVRQGRKQITVRRFGWSDQSQADADAQAEHRAQEALERVLSGEKLSRREPKIPYNGAEGVPIREEIVQRHGQTILTRNSYGAVCLNTPDVLFVDVDLDAYHLGGLPGCPTMVLIWLALILCLVGLGEYLTSWRLVVIGMLGSIPLAGVLTSLLGKAKLALAGGPELLAMSRIRHFMKQHPDWRMRLYRTPAGFRLLALHRTFDPREAEVVECFKQTGSDPMYRRMCFNQRCFRARVSPKPWRSGMGQHIRPRPGTWPIRPERLAERQNWVAQYEQKARNFASCRFMETLGEGREDPVAVTVQRLHDELCRADRDLPLA